MSKRLLSFACAGGILLAGCSGQRVTQPQGTALAEDVVRGGAQAPSRESELVYLLLGAELAGQRGQYEIALDNYLKAIKLSRDARVAARATQIALFLKNMDKAKEAVALWREADPGNAEARRISAMLFLREGHIAEAEEQLNALLSIPGGDQENSLIELVRFLNAEVPKEDGIALMRRLIERFPRMADLHFAFALLAADKNEYQLALDQTQAALALHPDWNRARLLQAQVMSQMGNSRAAREVIQKALKSDPNNSRLRLIYSQFLAKTGDLRGAERELNRILAKEPDNEDAQFGLAMALMEMGQQEKARQAFMHLAESARWKMQSFFYLGLIEARKGHMQSALQWFDRVTEGPLVFDAQVNAITALISLGQMSESRQRLVEVRQKFPNEALRLYLLEGELLTKNKDYAGAFDLLSEALEELPGQVELLYTRALVAERLGRLDVVEADLRAVLEKNPDDANALNALGFTLADRSERLEEARKYLDRALALKPDDPAILDSYGWLQYRLGNLESATDYLRRAYDMVKDPEIGAHLGEVLWESGKQKEAKKIWAEALKKDVSHEDMQKVKARYPEAFR